MTKKPVWVGIGNWKKHEKKDSPHIKISIEWRFFLIPYLVIENVGMKDSPMLCIEYPFIKLK